MDSVVYGLYALGGIILLGLVCGAVIAWLLKSGGTGKTGATADTVKKAPEAEPVAKEEPKADPAKPAATDPGPKPAPAKAGSGFFHTPAWRMLRNLAILLAFAGVGWWATSNWDYLVDTFNQAQAERAAGGAEAPLAPETPDAPAAPLEGEDGAVAPVATPAFDAVTHRVQTLYRDYVADTPVGDALVFTTNLSYDLGQKLGLPEHSITYVLGGVFTLLFLYVVYRIIRAIWRSSVRKNWLAPVLVITVIGAIVYYANDSLHERAMAADPALARADADEVAFDPNDHPPVVGTWPVLVEWNEALVVSKAYPTVNYSCLHTTVEVDPLFAHTLHTPEGARIYHDPYAHPSQRIALILESNEEVSRFTFTEAMKGELRDRGMPFRFLVHINPC